MAVFLCTRFFNDPLQGNVPVCVRFARKVLFQLSLVSRCSFVCQVIPLSQRSGLLEWCEGTQPIGEYLIGNAGAGVKGAHIRYRPNDWPHMDCRKHMAVTDNFKPVI